METDSDYDPLTFNNKKKVNRAKSKQKRVRFAPETKIRMIQLYEQHPCLWDTKHLDYWNRVERSKAEKEIADLLNYPETLVNTKWQILRNEFRMERNKVLRGRECNQAYESKWPFYSFLQFLNNHSNRPYKLNKRRSPLQTMGNQSNGAFHAVKAKTGGVLILQNLARTMHFINCDLLQEMDLNRSKDRQTPISIDSKLSLDDDNVAQPATVVSSQMSRPTYSNVCTYVTEKAARHSSIENVAQCLEIIDELSKKIRPVEQNDELRVLGEFVASQLKQIKSKVCRGKCVHELQRVLMEWQCKDDEFINELHTQQEWQIQEVNELASNQVSLDDVTDTVPIVDPLNGELAPMNF